MMMMMMLAKGASIISIIGVPFLLLQLPMGGVKFGFWVLIRGVNLAMCVLLMGGLTLQFGFCLWGG